MNTLGKVAYKSYRNFAGKRSLHTGVKLPKWKDLRIEQQMAWQYAAVAVSKEIKGKTNG